LIEWLKLLHHFSSLSISTPANNELTQIPAFINKILLTYPFSNEGEQRLVRIDCALDFSTNCPRVFLEALFINLLSNALHQIKKIGHGSIHIYSEEHDDYYLLRVKDTAGG